MRIIPTSFLALALPFMNFTALLSAEATPPSASETTAKKHLEPFTGKITKHKVRMRLQSTYDGQVLRELNQGDMVVVLGETEDFYAVQPPKEMRAYVFRTYVLDNVIEGNRVNVRLKPDLDAPIVAQLNSGDRVDGTINPAFNKWLEIKLPEATRFYVAKEYVEKAGDAGLMARLQKKKEAANHLLETADAASLAEMQKPFNEIAIEGIKANYQTIIRDYSEFPDAVTKARDSLAALQEAYTTRKLAFLESQSQQSAASIEAAKKLVAEVQAHKSKIASLEQQLGGASSYFAAPQILAADQPARRQVPINMAYWIPIEEGLYANWANEKGGSQSPTEFYEEQKQSSFPLKGVVEVYNRPVKNKPGDYMLLNATSKLPIAFLYSTQVNLHDYIGHEVTLSVVSRPNNNFAFPAYFVLSIE